MMNKNQLRQQNLYLFDRIQKLERENKRLLEQLKMQQETLDALKQQLEGVEVDEDDTEPLLVFFADDESANEQIETTEETVDTAPELSDEVNFGAEIIGEIVVKASYSSNQLKELGKTNVKELLNLILGRTEVSKGEILNIVSSDLSLDAKKDMIISVRDEVFEYFKSVLEQ